MDDRMPAALRLLLSGFGWLAIGMGCHVPPPWTDVTDAPDFCGGLTEAERAAWRRLEQQLSGMPD